MSKFSSLLILALFLAALGASSLAGSPQEDDSSLVPPLVSQGAMQSPEGEGPSRQALEETIKRLVNPFGTVTYSADSAIDGLVEIDLDGSTFYLTEDGRYLIPGHIYEIRDTGPHSLVDERKTAKRKELLASIDASDYLAFRPEGGESMVLTVFTDVDCTYCRRLHQELDDYLELGFEVRYLAYPRAGIGSDVYTKMVSAWCADDRNQAITRLKNGDDIPALECENTVAEQYRWGQSVGVTGTPTIILPDGRVVPGYIEAAKLAEELGI